MTAVSPHPAWLSEPRVTGGVLRKSSRVNCSSAGAPKMSRNTTE